MRIRGYKIRGLPFLITVAITIVFFVIVFDHFDIEINGNMVFAILLIGVISGGFVSMWMKGWLHEGHFSIVVGIIAITVSVTFLFGIVSFNFTDDDGMVQSREKLWTLAPQESGVFVLVGVLGVFSLISGVNQAMSNQFLWGLKR